MDDITAKQFQTHIQSWSNEAKNREKNINEFYSWFDSTTDVEAAFRAGQWDFTYHILKPKVIKLLDNPLDKTALEIGFGGGRLVCAAARYFKHCIGIDIHDSADLVYAEAEKKGIHNIELIKTDGESIPVSSNSIDFLYSYIVLQHLPTVKHLENYLSESRRVLHEDGVAILYFGYLPGSIRRKYADLTIQPVKNTRDVSLRVSIPFVKNLLKHYKLLPIEIRRATKKPWLDKYGSQFYVVAKPDKK